MHIANLRRAGGAIVLAVTHPQTKSRYTLDELLTQCDPTAEITAEDREWLDAAPIGRELFKDMNGREPGPC